jgi:hypothetical protein
METKETATKRGPCAVHDDRPAVGLCASCGRAVCLSCAIPFRGRVLCEECAARELGDPAPPPRPAARRPRRTELAAVLLLAAAVVATVPPWHSFGSLTGVLSVWRSDQDPWALAAAIGTLAAFLPTLWVALLRRGPGTLLVAACGVLSVAAAVAAARAIFGALDYVDHTAAPYVTLAGAAGAAVFLLGRLARSARR